jgi:hypothetical protein
MKKIFQLICLGVVVAVLAGCGNLQRQSRTFNTDGNSGITVDASQRAIYSVNKTFGDGKQWRAFCAEPSPDALSALVSSFGLDASVGAAGVSKALGLTGSAQDSTASIGLRTQTIQLLRDAMYRLCEGYASGALNDVSFARLQRRYQHVMLSLLAIEQLTGPVVAQQAALSGSASAGMGQALGEITKLVADQTAVVSQLERDLKEAKADAAKADATDQVKKKAKDLENQLSDAKSVASKLEEKFSSSQRLFTQASGQALFAASQSSGGAGTSTIALVAQKIESIVKHVVDADYTKDVCLDTLLSPGSDAIVGAKTFEIVVQFCAKAYKLDAKEAEALASAAKERSQIIKERTPPPPPAPRPN